MKRGSLFVILYAMCNIAIASKTILNNATVYNMSSEYSMEISYKICYFYTDYSVPFTCYPSQNIIINAKKGQNYSVITPPSPSSPIQKMFLEITKATEKDSAGNVVSQGNYTLNDTESVCSVEFSSDQRKWIILNDMNQSPNILCDESYLAN
jgi:hypothetical protein